MAFALMGEVKKTLRRGLTKAYKDPIYLWEDRAERHIKRNVGTMKGMAIHFFHGPKVHRRYGTREDILIEDDPFGRRDLHGGWHLVRMHRRPGEKRDNWLLIKGHDEAERAGADATSIEQSAPAPRQTRRQRDEPPAEGAVRGRFSPSGSAPANGIEIAALASVEVTKNRLDNVILAQHCGHILPSGSRQSAEEAEMMNSGHAQLAEALVFVHGLGAEAEAAMQANLCEKTGDTEIAETWREIQRAVRCLTFKKAA
jgi:hypothetical protein